MKQFVVKRTLWMFLVLFVGLGVIAVGILDRMVVVSVTPQLLTDVTSPLVTAVPTATFMVKPHQVMATPQVTLTSRPHRTRDADSMIMVYVPAGAFLMGSDKAIDPDAYANELPQHWVNLDAFWIDETEVTNAQYRKCVQAGVCQLPRFANDPNFNADNQPVVSVSWYDAKAYCQWAGADLPTEAQWEKAARGTDGRIYPWGNQPATCEYAVMGENLSNGCGKGNAAWPVGSKPKGASPYGVLDMSGNVLEWVEDWYEGYPGTPYQSDWFGTRVKVVRGGCWSVGRPHARAAARSGRYPDARGYLGSTVGFRCVAAVQKG